MIEYNKKPPLWENEGIEPTPEEITEGYDVGDKVPAPYLNFHLHQTGECIAELQRKLSNENTERKTAEESLRKEISDAGDGISADVNEHTANKENPHGVTAAQVGLDKVDNTPDSEKAVAFASEAGVGRKVPYNLSIRFNGGSTESTDLFTFNGSTSRNVNITPDKLKAAKQDLSNVENSDLYNKLKEIYIVEATSTDGVAYTATLDGITELYNGLEIVIIPNMTSTNTAVTFNLNGLGTKNLRAKINGYNNGNSGTIAALAGWIGENVPLAIRYISKFDGWQTVDFSRPSASGLYGTIKVEQGGTGATTVDGAKQALGIDKVPNVATNDQTPTYSDTNTLATLSSGEKLNVALQKIKCAITNLINHLNNKSNPHGVTASQIGAAASSHTHSASSITSGTLDTNRLPIVPVLKGGTGGTTPEVARENLGAAYTFITKVQALNTGWTLENGMYKQTVDCADLLSTDTPILDVFTNDSLDDNKLFLEAWSHVIRAIANDGNITLYADSTPDVSFSFNIKVVR